jgi:hypothetical protein
MMDNNVDVIITDRTIYMHKLGLLVGSLFGLAGLILFLHGVAVAPAKANIPEKHGLGIIEDGHTGAFRFVIDGKTVARLDAKGLWVRSDVTYGGSITDVGMSRDE